VGSADKDEKKRLKAQAKLEKKLAKAHIKQAKAAAKQGVAEQQTRADQPSTAVRFAETVRGILYLILSVSLVVAIILSNEGYIVTLEDIFKSLVVAWIGKIVLVVVAAAMFIYGLKHLRAVK